MVEKIVFYEKMVVSNCRKPRQKKTFLQNPLNLGHGYAGNRLPA